MKKNERITLAMMAADWRYGEKADKTTTECASRVLSAFPALQTDFDLLASSFASERIATRLVSMLGGRIHDPSGQQLISLLKARDAISEEVENWCDEHGESAAEFVDRNTDLGMLIADPSFRAQFAKASQADDRLLLFSQILEQASRS